MRFVASIGLTGTLLQFLQWLYECRHIRVDYIQASMPDCCRSWNNKLLNGLFMCSLLLLY